jgi:hypothetical protein
MWRGRSDCCVLAAGGQATVVPAIPVMNSRRRIVSPDARDRADGSPQKDAITAGNYSWRNGSNVSFCGAAILQGRGPKWVKSRHRIGAR